MTEQLITNCTEESTLVIKLGYRGDAFAGFAVQNDQRTVAGELIEALKIFFRRDVELTCAGRTDTGVHAQAQYVSLPVYNQEKLLSKKRIMNALDALTPDDISICNIYHAPQGFSARFDAYMRHYRYRIYAHQTRPVLSWNRAWWYKQPLNLQAMQQAASYLVGEHDFISFCKAQSALGKPTHRYVEAIDVKSVVEFDEQLIQINVSGNAFLHSMVRTIAGTLVEVGRGHREPVWVQDVLQAKNRQAAGPCAPAYGLTFVGVDYPPALLQAW